MGGNNTTNEPLGYEEERALDNEFNKLKNSQNVPVVKCEYVNNNKRHWKVVFKGSKSSPYEDGYFILEFLFKSNFPKKGPEARFITKMFHPNVKEDNGHVCISILNSWDEKMSIENVLYGIIELMDNPNASGGYYSNDATSLLKKNPDEYYKKVAEYTYAYAMEGF